MILSQPLASRPRNGIALILWLIAAASAAVALFPGRSGWSAGYGIAGVLAALPPPAVDLPESGVFRVRLSLSDRPAALVRRAARVSAPGGSGD